MTFGDLSLAALNADLQEVAPLLTRMDKLETQFIEARNERDALYANIWDKVKRARASVKGIYGDDSNEYEMLGGTRLSERKTARRKVSKTE